MKGSREAGMGQESREAMLRLAAACALWAPSSHPRETKREGTNEQILEERFPRRIDGCEQKGQKNGACGPRILPSHTTAMTKKESITRKANHKESAGNAQVQAGST
jgi:hypothetical protein